MINDADVLDWIGEYEPAEKEDKPLTRKEKRLSRFYYADVLDESPVPKKDKHIGEVKVCGEWFKLNEEVDWTIVHYMGSYQICSYKVRFIKLDGTVMGKFDDGEIIPADSMITWVTYTENEFGWWEKYSEHKSVAKVKDFLRKVGEA